MYNIVNLTTYRQFTNAAWIIVLGLFKEKKKKKEKKRKEIKIALRLGYPNSYFYNKRCKYYFALMAIVIIFLIIYKVAAF